MKTIVLPWFVGVRPSVRTLAAIFLAAVSTAAAIQASGTTIYVAKTGTNIPACGLTSQTACLTIQYAIDNIANTGDTINIAKGVYYEQLTIARKDLTLAGPPTQGAVILDGKKIGTPVTNIATTTLNWLTIRNGNFIASAKYPSGGAGINNQRTLTLNNVFIDGNSVSADFADEAPLAAGILNSGTLHINSSEIELNTATGGCFSAGAIANSGTLYIADSLIQLDNATADPNCGPPIDTVAVPSGILNNSGTVQLETTQLNEDGISNNGTFNISQSTVKNASVEDYSKMVVVNSTFYQAPITIEGGEFNGLLNMTSSTVWDSSGPGLVTEAEPYSSTLSSTLLVGNSTSNCVGNFISSGYVIEQSNSPCNYVGDPDNYHGYQPNLGQLGWNGGPTETMMPLHGSPALYLLRAGPCTDSKGKTILVDQRGDPRGIDGNCDTGAVQITVTGQ